MIDKNLIVKNCTKMVELVAKDILFESLQIAQGLVKHGESQPVHLEVEK